MALEEVELLRGDRASRQQQETREEGSSVICPYDTAAGRRV
jgi:hypothetical protein